MRWTLLALRALAGCDDHILGPTNLDTGAAATYEPTWEGVQQLIVDHCERCHTAGGTAFELVPLIEDELAAMAGTTGATTGASSGTTGGATGTGVTAVLVVPGDPESSLLWQTVTATGGALPMPLDTGLLDAETVDPIREWIASGAAL